MDVPALIEAVRKRPPIWDKTSKLYANRDTTDSLWKEITDELDYDETLLRRKWKYLRDNFAVVYSKCCVGGAEESAHLQVQQIKWVYLEPLLFLKDVVKPRKKQGFDYQYPRPVLEMGGYPGEDSFSSTDPTEVELDIMMVKPEDSPAHVKVEEGGENFGQGEGQVECQASDHDDTDSQEGVREVEGQGQEMFLPSGSGRRREAQPFRVHRGRKRRRDQDERYSRSLEMPGNNLSYHGNSTERFQHINCRQAAGVANSSKEAEDVDLLFLRTLLPHIRRIPQRQKLRFQGKVMAVVESFAYGNSQTITDLTIPNDSAT